MVLNRHSAVGLLLFAVVSVVCPAQDLSATPDSAAKVISITGQVSILKDSNPWALQLGSTVQLKQMIVTGPDGFAVLQVSDGSTFEVYPNSKVTFRNNPSEWKDLLDLWIGRVKVHIQKLSGGAPNHQRVTSPTAVISVRGTIFDVVADDEDMTLVTVEEGLVGVQHRYLPVNNGKLISPGEYIRVYKNQPLAEKSIDKGQALRHAMNAGMEAVYRVILRSPQVPGGGGRGPTTGGTGGTGGGVPGDTKNDPPPPPTTPPPPPPPPGV
jgi:ferric-dicitrate binding protein FerR (iron transport regulator)